MSSGTFATDFRCWRCGSKYKLTSLQGEQLVLTKCPKDGSALDIEYDYNKMRKHIRRDISLKPRTKVSHWKYWMFYPVAYRHAITMDEGGTGIVKSVKLGKKLGLELFFKNEGTNPTGSFKDRGSTIELTKAKELGDRHVFCATTGNMGASVSAYAARAGIEATIFLPRATPRAKLSQILAHGARISKVGTYEEAAQKAVHAAHETNHSFLAGDYPYRGEGEKSVGFEIADQFHLEQPDSIFVPVGNGRLIYSVYKALRELEIVGILQKMPRLIAVQAKGADPVVQAFKNNFVAPIPLKRAKTIASAIAVADPVAGAEALYAIRKTHGFALSVSDKEIMSAAKLLGAEGIYAEPGGAASTAGLIAARKDRKLRQETGSRALCLVTGHGLKGIK